MSVRTQIDALIAYLASDEGRAAREALPDTLRASVLELNARTIAARQRAAAKREERERRKRAEAEEMRAWNEECAETERIEAELLTRDPVEMTGSIVIMGGRQSAAALLEDSPFAPVTDARELYQEETGEEQRRHDRECFDGRVKEIDVERQFPDIPGSIQKAKNRTVFLARFPAGRSTRWVETYCQNRPYEPATIWDGLRLPIDFIGARRIVMSGSPWNCPANFVDPSYECSPVFTHDKDKVVLGLVISYSHAMEKFGEDVWWLMVMKT